MSYKIYKRIIAAVVCILLVISTCYSGAGLEMTEVEAEEESIGYEKSTFEIESTSAQVGETFTVDVKVHNNTAGLAGIGLYIYYNAEDLGLVGIEFNSNLSGITTTPQGYTKGEEYELTKDYFMLSWASMSGYAEENFTFVTLTFDAKKIVDSSDIELLYNPNNVYDGSETNVEFDIVNGSVTIYDIIEEVKLSGSITTPKKFETDSSSLTGDNVEVDVSWSPKLINGQFAAGTSYTAIITASGANGYVLGASSSISYGDYTFLYVDDDDTYVATKEFDATEVSEVTEISVTTNPDDMSYVDGEVLDTTGMVVVYNYDDGGTSVCEDYTITYNTGDAFVKGDTIVTITSDDFETTLSGLTVSGKTATTGLFTYTEPTLTYDGNDQTDTIEDKISVAGTVETRGSVTYTYKYENESGEKVDVTEITNAGTYTIYAALAGGSEYDAMEATEIGEITIAQKEISSTDFTIDTTDKTYTSKQITPSVTSSVLSESDYAVSYGKNTNADEEATIKIVGSGNYTGTINETFDITPVVIIASDLEYTGTAVSKTYDGTTSSVIKTVDLVDVLLDGDTLEITGTAVYSSANVANNLTVTFTPDEITSGNYTIASTVKLEITGASIIGYTDVKVTSDEYTYLEPFNVVKGDGSFAEPTFSGVGSETVTGDIFYTYDETSYDYEGLQAVLKDLAEGKIATISYIFTGSGNYVGADVSGTIVVQIVDIEFSVNGVPASVTNTVTITGANAVYGNSWSDILTINENVIATVNGIGDDTGEYTLSVSGYPNAGEQSYSVQYTGTINEMEYTDIIVCEGTITIASKTLTEADLVYSGTFTKEYDGTTAGTNVNVSVNSNSLVGEDKIDDIAASVTYNSADVNSASTAEIVTTEGITSGNYSLESGLVVGTDYSATITPLTVSPAIDDITSVNYTGGEQKPTVSITLTYFSYSLAADTDYEVSYSNNTNAGTATVTVTDVDNNNFNFTTVTKTFTINKINYTGTTTATESTVYGNSGTIDLSTLNLPLGYDFGTVVVDNTSFLYENVSLNGTKIEYSVPNNSDYVEETGVITIPVTSTNYNDFNVVLTITVDNKTEQTGFAFAETVEEIYTYGETSFELSVVNNKTETVIYESSNTDVISISGNTATILNAGEATITATVPEDLTYLSATTTQTITVNPVTLTVKDLEYTDTFTKEYDGTNTGTAEGETIEVSIKADSLVDSSDSEELGTISATYVYDSANVEDATYATITTSGEITSGNYRLASGLELTADASITPIAITAVDLKYTGTAVDLKYTGTTVFKTYDGTTDCDITEVDLVDGVLKGTDQLEIQGTSEYDSADVAFATKVTFTPDAITEGNYTLATTETLEITASISAATNKDITNTTPTTSNVVVGDGTFPVPSFTGVGSEVATGDITYTYGEVVTMSYDDIKAELAKLAKGAIATVDYEFTGTGNYVGATVSGSIAITIVDIQFTVGDDDDVADEENCVTVNTEALVYGSSWDDILSVNNGITAIVNGYDDNGTGTYSILETGTPDAGTQTYTVVYNGTISGKDYEDVTVCTGSVIIAAKALTANDLEYTGDAVSKTYDGTTKGDDVTVSVKTSALVGNDTISAIAAEVTYNSANVSDAESATITIKDGITSGNYSLAKGLEVTKVDASISPLEVTVEIGAITAVDYDGDEQEQILSLTVTDSKGLNYSLTTDDYTVEYSDNVNAGTAKVVVSDVDNSNFTFDDAEQTFTINKITYTVDNTISGSTVYGNAGSVDLSELALPEGYLFGTITVDEEDMLFVSKLITGTTVSYTITDSSDYVGKQVILTIPVSSTNYSDYEITATITVLNKEVQTDFAFAEEKLIKTYGDASFTLVAEDNESAEVKYESSDSTIISIDGTTATILKAGTVTITATAAEDSTYQAATAEQTITVNPVTLTVKDLEYTGLDISKGYNGTTNGGTIQVSVKENSLVEGDSLGTIDATYTYNSANVKDATYVTITTTEAIEDGNYRLDSGLVLTEEAEITPMTVTVEVADIDDMTYTGTERKPTVVIKNTPHAGFVEGDYSVAYSNNTNVGEAIVTISTVANSNYTFATITKTFDITKVSYTGLTEGTDTTRYGNEGSYDITTDIALPAGYALGSITVQDTSGVLEGSVELDGTTLSYEFANEKDNVGKTVTVTIPVTSSDNYEAYSITVTLTVSSKLAQNDFAFTANSISKTYGDDSFALAVTGMLSSNGIEYKSSDETVLTIVDGVATIVGSGTATITATAVEGLLYAEATATQTVTVSKKSITVTAADAKVLVNGTMPGFTYTMTSLAYDDAVIKAATLTTEAIDTATVGAYNITGSGLEVENSSCYDITYVSGTLKVIPEYQVTLDANGGVIETSSLTTDVNQNIVGLSDPTRSNNLYIFDGWYTAATGGTQVTSSTVIGADTTLYAQWIMRASEDSGEVSTEVQDTITNLSEIETFTPEQTEVVNTFVEEVVYDINVEEARDNVETMELLATLDTIFVEANANLTVSHEEPTITSDVEESVQLPNIPVEVSGLALAVFAGKEVETDTNLYLDVQQEATTSDGAIVISILPILEADGMTRVIENSELQTPISFKVYLNDSVASEYVDILHKFTGGGEETFRLQVQEDELGKYVFITVTKFSEFHITEVVELEADATVTTDPTDSSEDTTTDGTGTSAVDTGDYTPIIPLISLLLISLIGIIMLFNRRKVR